MTGVAARAQSDKRFCSVVIKRPHLHESEAIIHIPSPDVTATEMNISRTVVDVMFFELPN